MAQKQQTGRNASAAKKPAAKKPAAKKPTKKEIEQARLEALARERHERKMQIAALAIFFSSILFFLLAAVPGGVGSLYNRLHEFHLTVWGFSAFLLPVLTIVLAYFLSRDKEGDKPWAPFVWCCVLLFFVSQMMYVILCDTFQTQTYMQQLAFEYYNRDTMCGIFAAVFGGLLYLLCRSKVVCVLLYAAVICLVVFLLSKITVQNFLHLLGAPIKRVGKATGQAVSRRREERQREVYDFPEDDMPTDVGDRGRYAPPPVEPDDGGSRPARVRFVDYDSDGHTEKTEEKKRKKRTTVEATVLAAQEEEASARQSEEAAVGEPPSDGESIEPDEFEKMFATVNAMERAAEEEQTQRTEQTRVEDRLFGTDERSDEAPPFDLFAAPDVPGEEEQKIRLSAAEFDDAKQEVAEQIAESEQAPPPVYILPPLECLNVPKSGRFTANRDELRANADKLIAALHSFKVEAKVVDIIPGPSVTRYELQPASGVKISKFTNLSDDLALHLAAPAGVRIEAPIPNKSAIGIEIPNRDRVSVYMRELIDTDEFRNADSKLYVALGKDISGSGVYLDLAKMPHLLVAGTTGSGKSVCLNSMIVSILYNAKPSEVRLLLIDPKTVEFSVYNDIPHLLVPVVNEPRKAAGALGWAVTEMVNRYKILNDNGVRDISSYNKLCEERAELEKLPQIVIVIDELSDLMSVAPSEVEDSITRLAQMARAAGMHLVVATQRPSVDVITGLIKANIPSRIALSVSSQIDSRTILDASGAEKLLGNGDMLVAPVGRRKPMRVQGCYVSDAEIRRVVDFVKTQEGGHYDESVQDEIDRQAVAEKKKTSEKAADVLDGSEELMMRAIDFIVNNPESCSISALQRKLGMGFSKAGRLMDTLEEKGIVGPSEGSKGRKVLLSKAEWEQMRALSSQE